VAGYKVALMQHDMSQSNKICTTLDTE